MECDQDNWLPLVSKVNGGFVLSEELRTVAGPVWGRSWELKAFVAHLISHFDNPLEHLLDYFPSGDTTPFDIDPEWCQILSSRHQGEFYDLPAEWYRTLFQAKLLSLRIPARLVSDAKWAYLKECYQHKTVIASFFSLVQVRKLPVAQGVLMRCLSFVDLEPQQAWELFEPVLVELLQSGAINEQHLDDILVGEIEE